MSGDKKPFKAADLADMDKRLAAAMARHRSVRRRTTSQAIAAAAELPTALQRREQNALEDKRQAWLSALPVEKRAVMDKLTRPQAITSPLLRPNGFRVKPLVLPVAAPAPLTAPVAAPQPVRKEPLGARAARESGIPKRPKKAAPFQHVAAALGGESRKPLAPIVEELPTNAG